MKNGTCIKCQSTNVVMTKSVHGGIGPGFTLNIMTDGSSMTSTREWRTYLCLDCGYIETYLTDRAAMEKIRSSLGRGNWTKVR